MSSSRPFDAQAAAQLGFLLTGMLLLIFNTLPGLFTLLASQLDPPGQPLPTDILIMFWASWGGTTALATGLIMLSGRLARWFFPDRADDPVAPPATLLALQAGLAPALAIIGAVLLSMTVPDLLYYLIRASRTSGVEGGAPEAWLRCLAQFFIGLSFFVFPRSLTRLVHQLHNLASEKSAD